MSELTRTMRDEVNERLAEARQVVLQHRQIGIGMLARHMSGRVGYAVVVRLLEALELEGIVGPATVDGRQVLLPSPSAAVAALRAPD